jgi:transcriptional regulator with XRE-family HTH domain
MEYSSMRIKSELVAELRRERSWSQDELAIAAGLNLRTVQRIENVGTASLQSIKSIAAALEAEFEDFIPEKSMGRFEYKTVVLPFEIKLFRGKGLPNIQGALNKEGRDGWQFKQIIMPSTVGDSNYVVAILERPVQ